MERLTDYELEVITYELQGLYIKLEEILKKLPNQYHDLKQLNK